MCIDESNFRPLYCKDHRSPNSSVRLLVAMMVLKEAEGLSDQKIFENCRFNLLVRSALGLHNADDPLPTESTYFLFRKRIVEYEKEKGRNLFKTAFTQITKEQCSEFEVSDKRIRMDSKLLGSNITESCDNDKPLNLTGNIDVKEASASDSCFLVRDIEKAQEVFPDKTEAVHADGAYHSPDNQKFCKDNEIDLYLHAIQGAKGRYQFNLAENSEQITENVLLQGNGVKLVRPFFYS